MMSEPAFPFMVRYPFDPLTVLSLSTLLKTLRISKGNVEGLTMNGNSYGCGRYRGFALSPTRQSR